MCDSIDFGVELGCRDNMGGISTIYLGEFDSAATITTGTATNGYTMVEAFTSSSVFYEYQVQIETGALEGAIQSSIENGTVFSEDSLTFRMYRNDSKLYDAVRIISRANSFAIIKDQNGNYFLMGKDNGCKLSAGTRSLGSTYDSMNGAELTLMAKEKDGFIQIEETLAETILGL